MCFPQMFVPGGGCYDDHNKPKFDDTGSGLLSMTLHVARFYGSSNQLLSGWFDVQALRAPLTLSSVVTLTMKLLRI